MVGGCGQKEEPVANQTNRNQAPTSEESKPPASNRVAVIETGLGTVKIELLYNEAPKTAENFRLLAERGFYNGTIFHRVIRGFMIQGGDPKGDGTGGETANRQPLPNEINFRSSLYQGGYRRGLVAMANKGTPETGTSQFFIMHQTNALAPSYTIFGRVTEGMDVVDKIATTPTSGPPLDRPTAPVKMTRVYIQ
jgi:cyclophilin family peptidyl-prolyl cis-trans isomerase